MFISIRIFRAFSRQTQSRPELGVIGERQRGRFLARMPRSEICYRNIFRPRCATPAMRFCGDDGTYYGEVPECPGVYANTTRLEECREELREVLEEWILFRVHRHLPLPVIDDIELTIKEVA